MNVASEMPLPTFWRTPNLPGVGQISKINGHGVVSPLARRTNFLKNWKFNLHMGIETLMNKMHGRFYFRQYMNSAQKEQRVPERGR